MTGTKSQQNPNATESSIVRSPAAVSALKEAMVINDSGNSTSFNNLGSPSSFVALGVMTDGSGANDGVLRDSNGVAISSLIANFSPRTGLLADLLRLDGGAGELASPTDKNAIVKFNGSPNQGVVFHAVPSMLGVAVVTAVPSSNVPGIFSTRATFVVGTHFTDNVSALTFMQQCSALAGVVITLRLANGSIYMGVTVPMPWLAISGNATHIANLQIPFASIGVTDGSDGSRTLNLDVSAENGTRFAVGQPFGILLTAQQGGSAMTGTNKENLVGSNSVVSITVGTGSNGIAVGKTRVAANYGLNEMVDTTSSLPGACTGVILLPPVWFTASIDIANFNSIFGVGFSAGTTCYPSFGVPMAGAFVAPYIDCVVSSQDLTIGPVPHLFISRSAVAGINCAKSGSTAVDLENVAIGGVDFESGTSTGLSLAAGASAAGRGVSITGQTINLSIGNRVSFVDLVFIMSSDTNILDGGAGSHAIEFGYAMNVVAVANMKLIRTTQVAAFAKNTAQANGSYLTY